MNVPRPIVLGTVACLLVGLVLATALANAQGTTPVGATEVTLPVGHHGDEVTYGIYDRWDTGGELGRGGTPTFSAYYAGGSSSRLSGVQVFSIAGEGEILDAQGVLRKVLLTQLGGRTEENVESLSIYPEPVAYFRNSRTEASIGRDAAAPPLPHLPIATTSSAPVRSAQAVSMVSTSPELEARHQYIDLSSRLMVRNDDQVATEVQYYSLGSVDEAERTDLEQTVWTSFDSPEPEMFALRYQGKTLRLGDELLPTTEVDRFGGWEKGASRVLRHSGWYVNRDTSPRPSFELHSADVESITVREWVAERARVDGREALAVWLEATVRYREPAWQDQPAGPWKTWTSRIVTWLTAGNPYPVLIQSNRFDRSLAEFVPGNGPAIGWQEAKDAAQPPAPERTLPIQRYPADGADTSLAYPLGQALRDVDASGSTNYTLWRLNHPDALLAAADLSPDGEFSTWRLLFAQADGQAYEMSTRRSPTSTTAAVVDVGGRRAPAFDPATLPNEPITFAAAEGLWRSHAAADFSTAQANVAHWGLPAWVRYDDLSDDQCSLTRENLPNWGHVYAGVETWVRARNAFHEIEIGHMRLEPCRGGVAAHAVESLFTVETDGAAVELVENRKGFAVPEPTVHNYEKAELTLASYAHLKPPRIEYAALATGSLLVVFLAVYLAPLLKYAGAQTWAVLPGYSKLARDSLLDNKVRDALLANITQDPGVHATELAHRVHAGWGTVVYHLSVLERNRLVSSLVDGRHRRFFPIGIVDYSRRGQLAILRNERTKALFARIADEPGIIQESLAASVGLTRPAAIWHLTRLEESGLVGRVRKGRKVHYYTNETPSTAAPYDPKEAREVA